MNNFKKIITIAAGTAAISAMAATASAVTTHAATVSCYKSDSQHYKSGEYELETFYDYGTSFPFDNARIYAEASNDSTGFVYAFIKYADFNANSFKTTHKSSYGGTAYVNYNPAGVDTLKPGSYANAYGNDQDFYLRVTD